MTFNIISEKKTYKHVYHYLQVIIGSIVSYKKHTNMLSKHIIYLHYLDIDFEPLYKHAHILQKSNRGTRLALFIGYN
jgi:hypothetical protein